MILDKRALAVAEFAAGRDECRKPLRYVRVEPDEIAATNGNILAAAPMVHPVDHYYPTGLTHEPVEVDVETLKSAFSLLPKKPGLRQDSQVAVGTRDGKPRIAVKPDGMDAVIELRCKECDGDYPDWRRVAQPLEHDQGVLVAFNADLLEKIARAAKKHGNRYKQILLCVSKESGGRTMWAIPDDEGGIALHGALMPVRTEVDESILSVLRRATAEAAEPAADGRDESLPASSADDDIPF